MRRTGRNRCGTRRVSGNTLGVGWRRARVVLPAILLFGCAYYFSGSNLPSHIKTVAIPNFANETLEPALDQEATTAVLDRFVKDGRLKLAPESRADALLSGRIVRYENRVNNYGPDQSPRDYVVVIALAVEMKDQVKNRELWKDDQLTRSSVWAPTSESILLTTEAAAREDALRTLAGEIVTRTLEQW